MSMAEQLAQERMHEHLRTAVEARKASHLAAARRWRRLERMAHAAHQRHDRQLRD